MCTHKIYTRHEIRWRRNRSDDGVELRHPPCPTHDNDDEDTTAETLRSAQSRLGGGIDRYRAI